MGVAVVAGTLLLPQGAPAEPAAPAVAANSARGEELLTAMSFSPERGPVTISAQALEFNYRTRELVYRGGVTLKQADLVVEARRLRITLDEKPREGVSRVIAEGAVRIHQGDRVATGGRAAFDQKRRMVVLSEDAVLRDGPNRVTGDRVVVYLDEQRSVVQGGTGRVRAVLYPKQVVDEPHPPVSRASGLVSGTAHGS